MSHRLVIEQTTQICARKVTKQYRFHCKTKSRGARGINIILHPFLNHNRRLLPRHMLPRHVLPRHVLLRHMGTSWGSVIFLSARWTLQSQGSPREWNKCHNWESFDFHFCRGPWGSFEVWTCIATMNSRVHSCSQSKSQTMNSRVHSCCAGQNFKIWTQSQAHKGHNCNYEL